MTWWYVESSSNLSLDERGTVIKAFCLCLKNDSCIMVISEAIFMQEYLVFSSKEVLVRDSTEKDIFAYMTNDAKVTKKVAWLRIVIRLWAERPISCLLKPNSQAEWASIKMKLMKEFIAEQTYIRLDKTEGIYDLLTCQI